MVETWRVSPSAIADGLTPAARSAKIFAQFVGLEVCKSFHGLSLSVFEQPKDYRHEPSLLQSFLDAEKRAIRTGIQVNST